MDDFLVKMMAHVEQQYSNIERECLVLRKLLKPWPKKKHVSEDKQPEAIKQAEEQEKDKNNALTQSEKLALEEMNRLLNKAQKAIRIKDKVTHIEKLSVTDSNMEGQDDSVENVEVVAECKEDLKTSLKSQSIRNIVNDKSSKGKPAIQKKDASLMRKNPPQTRFSSLSSAKDARSGQQVPSRLSSSRSITPRPSSTTQSSSRPPSSQSRYTPAHVNAPFKTDVNTRVPNRKHNHIYKNHFNKAQQRKNASTSTKKQPSQLNGLKTLPRISPVVQASGVDSASQDFDDTETKAVGDASSCNESHQAPVSNWNLCVVEGAKSNKSEGFLGDESNIPCQEQNMLSEKAEQPCLKQEELFSLKDKGSKIKIPQRLHKLVAENHTLLEKCSTAKIVKKMPNTDVAHNFVERLNDANEVSQELWTKTKAITCLQSHQLMLKCLNSLGLETISERTPFQTVYRAKRLLEFILTKFAETQEEADYFSKVQFRQIQPCRMNSSASNLDEKDAIESFFKTQETETARCNYDWLTMDALASSKAWTQLQFEKNVHRLQLRLLSLTESEWWQTLCQQPINGGVVQAIHSLLTSSGELFPAIVENPYS